MPNPFKDHWVLPALPTPSSIHLLNENQQHIYYHVLQLTIEAVQTYLDQLLNAKQRLTLSQETLNSTSRETILSHLTSIWSQKPPLTCGYQGLFDDPSPIACTNTRHIENEVISIPSEDDEAPLPSLGHKESNSGPRTRNIYSWPASNDTVHWEKDSLFSWAQRRDDLCRNLFQISQYRQHQREIMNATLSKEDVFVLMPTGGGKSICYQLPALLTEGFTLVISPLISLIQDQVIQLSALNIGAEMLTGHSSKEDTKVIHQRLLKDPEGMACLKLLYVTPEKIAKSKRFMSYLEKAWRNGRLSRIVVDEAHCCSTLGFDFRPDYKALGILKIQFPNVPLIALTATATPSIFKDVKGILKIPNCLLFRSSFNRPNLFYKVLWKPSDKKLFLENIINIVNSYSGCPSGIVYCFSRKEAYTLAQDLRKHGIKAAPYYSDIEIKEKEKIHRLWMNDEIQVVVATIAFGLGINKPNVRFVIHHTMSKSLDAYYQESGRAGRDGLRSDCILFYRGYDLTRLSTMVFSETSRLDQLYQMARYCENHITCRRRLIGEFFDDDSKLNTAFCHGMCDVCTFNEGNVKDESLEEVDVTEEARHLVQFLKDYTQSPDCRLTLLQLVEKFAKSRLQESELDLRSDRIERLVVKLLLEGILEENFHFTPYSTISYLQLGPAATPFSKSKPLNRITMFFFDKNQHQHRLKRRRLHNDH